MTARSIMMWETWVRIAIGKEKERRRGGEKEKILSCQFFSLINFLLVKVFFSRIYYVGGCRREVGVSHFWVD